MLPVEQSFKPFSGIDGKPLSNGAVYFGLPNQDPIAHPVTVFWEAAGTLPALQPLRTVNGYIVNESGSAANVFCDGPYSQLVQDSKGRQVFYARTSDEFSIGTKISSFLSSVAGATGATLIGFAASFAGAKTRKLQDKAGDIISVKDALAVGDGAADDSVAILAADGSGAKVRYPKGSFKFTSATNPTFSGGVEFDNAVVVGTRAGNQPIVAFDKSGKLIGLQHNHKEQRTTDFGGANTAITTGNILPPPVSNAGINGPVDVLAHWYNDSGLECVRAANGGIGSVVWYYWNWNHSDTSFDPKRKPLLGFYRGDDANVLDWQCYWLREAGVTGVILDVPNLSTATWASPQSTNRDYWAYQLFNRTQNFPGLKYVLSMACTELTSAAVVTQWIDAIVNVYLKYPNFYSIRKNGKLWPVVFVYDMAILRAGIFDIDGGVSKTKEHLANMAGLFRLAGFGGMCVIGRNSGYFTDLANYNTLADLEQFGVVMYAGEYAKTPGETGTEKTYDDYLTNFAQTTWRTLPNVCTSHESKAPHPSGWTQTGSTPAKFNRILQKAVNAALNNPTAPPIVTVYNVAEWAEGGASLQPNMADGFGYLDAVRAVMTGDVRDDSPLPYSLLRIDGASTNILPLEETVGIYTTFSVTLAAAPYLPTIAPGFEGQKVKLLNIPAVGNYDIGLNDEGTTPGTGLFLTAPTVLLGAYDSVELTYKTGKGWVQSSAVVNVL